MRTPQGITSKAQETRSGFRRRGREVVRACQFHTNMKVLAIMINIGVAIIYGSSSTNASVADPTIVVSPCGTAVEALPENPGKIAVTLSSDYVSDSRFEVHAHVGTSPNGNFEQTIPIAPGETVLTPALPAGQVYPRLYLLDKSSKEIVTQTILGPVTIAAAAVVDDVSPVEDIVVVVVDDVAPVLSKVTAVATGTGTADVAVTTNEGSGQLYWAVTKGSMALSATELMSGAGAVCGSQAVTEAGTHTVSLTGLEPDTAYTLHLLQTDTAGNIHPFSQMRHSEPVRRHPLVS